MTALCLVYEYYPDATTVGNNLSLGKQTTMLETQAWSLLFQILSALKTIHSNGISQMILDVFSVVSVGPDRYKVGWLGLGNILFKQATEIPSINQRKDLSNLGVLLLALLSKNLNVMTNISESLNSVQMVYSSEMYKVVSTLISNADVSLEMILTSHSTRLLAELDSANKIKDEFQESLSLELSNGRLCRLMTKLNFINGRPEQVLKRKNEHL
ncbi:hypothetical protein BB559_002769 [Furculomyces boomerangus]|uniref:Pan3 C-terminal knob domain-containing protein n=1 Tax=Furculomyces boomerangus TaxID=61424 RepID=A0A2T9YSP7_9FUNG|nr:hypothetical protein BB559_002769 [Furculomyces boomerangus]